MEEHSQGDLNELFEVIYFFIKESFLSYKKGGIKDTRRGSDRLLKGKRILEGMKEESEREGNK